MKLNDNFWDCECKADYIQYKHTLKCRKCGCRKEDQPDSRAEEVDAYFNDTVQMFTIWDLVAWHTHYSADECYPEQGHDSFWFSDTEGGEIDSYFAISDMIMGMYTYAEEHGGL